MRSFQSKPDTRRQVFLRLAGEIESQLRDAYDRKYRAGEATQSSLAKKLKVNRSAIHHRLTGRTNMRTETIADMVWALGCNISVRIFDAKDSPSNSVISVDDPPQFKELPPPKTSSESLDFKPPELPRL